MELKLYKGRPEDIDKRLEKERKVYDLLDTLNIEYERIDHAPVMTMEACEEIEICFFATVEKQISIFL